jgi:hypothetical protein
MEAPAGVQQKAYVNPGGLLCVVDKFFPLRQVLIPQVGCGASSPVAHSFGGKVVSKYSLKGISLY